MKHCSYILAFIAFSLIQVSCEKGLDLIEVDGTVYIPQSGISEHSVLLGESYLNLGVYQSGVHQKTKGLEVTMAVDPSALEEFLADNPGFEILPKRYYDIPETKVSFSAGAERNFLPIHLKKIGPDFVDKHYVLPVSIKDVTPEVEVLDDKRTSFLVFPRYRNMYEGSYKAFGTVTGQEGKPTEKIDAVINAGTAGPQSVLVDNIVKGHGLILTVKGEKVEIKGAPGAEDLEIVNQQGKSSTFTGEFDPTYQRANGTFQLDFSYDAGDGQKDVKVNLDFWLD